MNEPTRQQPIAGTVPTASKLDFKELPSSTDNANGGGDDPGKSKQAPMAPELKEEEEAPEPSQSSTNNSSKRNNQRIKVKVIPQAQPIPWHRFIYMSILVAIPTAIYIAFFTAMGWGETSFNYLSTRYGEEYTGVVGGATALWFLILYLLDANTWKSRFLQGICGTIFVLGVLLTIAFVVANYPFGPICAFATVTPLWLLTVISIGRRGSALNHRTKEYVQDLSKPLFFVSILTVIAFCAWVFVGDAHEFNEDTKAVFSQITMCTANVQDYPECQWQVSPHTLRPNLASPAAWNDTTRYLHQASFYPLDGFSTKGGNDNDQSTQTVLASEILKTEVEREENAQTKFSASAQQSTPIQSVNNMFLSEDTGVCFDTVIDPPSIRLHEGCDPSCPRDVYSACSGALLLWAGPMLCSMVLFFLSFFCTFLKGNDVEKDVINFGKLWLFLLFTIWITVSLAGVGAGISTVLAAMTLASFVGAIFFVTMTRPKADSKEQAWLLWNKFEEKCGGYLNVARAIFLVFGTPLILLYFGLAILNQSVRKLGLPCSKEIKTPEERADFVTKRARLQIKDIQSWERTKVLTYGVYVGLTYMIMSVVISKFAYLIMTLLVAALDGVNLAAVTFILLAFGITFFLNPFLPGPPVYTMYGLVLMATGEEVLGVYGALAYAVGLSVVVKLMACTVQQKLIGENLAKYVSVRKLVGINSGLIKATRLILAQPGIKIDKVSILVGGPDWPTSVLCGIMHLDLLPILVGTIPVIVISGPTALLGSFLYMADQRGEDGELLYPSAASLAALSTAAAAVVCLAVPIMAAYYLEQKMTQAADEIAAMPIDKEVAELEDAEIEYNNCYEKVTQWDALPGVAKLLIYIAFVLMVISVYIVLVIPQRCFSEYSLTSTVEKDLDGEWTNLIKPFGWICIALFMVSWSIIIVFTSWAGAKAKDMVASKSAASEATEGKPVSDDAT